MGMHATKVEPHWSYFLAIEQDLERLARFVDFDKRNFGCFSIEIAHPLLTSAAEVDVVCKQLCIKHNPNSRAGTIAAYKPVILEHYPRLPRFVVTIPRYGLTLKPWSNWNPKRKNDISPLWWTAYNKIKHHRHTNFQMGRLDNALNSVAGLFVMILHLNQQRAEQGKLLPNPRLLRVTQENLSTSEVYNSSDLGFRYVLKSY